MCKDFEQYLKKKLKIDMEQELPGASGKFEAAYRRSNFQAWDECYRAFGDASDTLAKLGSRI